MIEADCDLAANTSIPFPDLVNIYGCKVGPETFVGPFVEIQRGAIIGKRCRVQSHSFICDRVIIGDDVFIGHGVMFCNDLFPTAGNKTPDLLPVTVGCNASIGSGATILPGVKIGKGALVGAGAVVCRDVADYSIVAGNPARSK